MLIYLGCSTVVAFATALLLVLLGEPPAAAAHAAFAAGAMPLIFAAMAHFVPVLTRSAGAEARIARLPLAAQAAGVLAVGALAGLWPGEALHGALFIGLAGAAMLLVWMCRRGLSALGRPHPGLYWYMAALVCLILALLAIAAGLLRPPLYLTARRIHLHLNTLGFIGLSAVGTLHVLMPTALGRPDSAVVARLRRHLPWMLAGIAATVLAVFQRWLAPFAAAVLVACVLAMVGGWWRTHGLRRLLGDGVAASLLVASLGLAGLVLAGAGHGLGWWQGRPAVAGFFCAFLLPLVTGALSQLIPVWRYPGPLTPVRTALRASLARHGVLRASLFLASGLVLPVFPGLAAGLSGAGVALFAAALLAGLLRSP